MHIVAFIHRFSGINKFPACQSTGFTIQFTVPPVAQANMQYMQNICNIILYVVYAKYADQPPTSTAQCHVLQFYRKPF